MTKISKKKGGSTYSTKASKVSTSEESASVEEKSETTLEVSKNNRSSGSGGAFIELGGGVRIPATK